MSDHLNDARELIDYLTLGNSDLANSASVIAIAVVAAGFAIAGAVAGVERAIRVRYL